MNEETAYDTQQFLQKRLSAIKNQRSTGELEDLALIIGEPSPAHEADDCLMLLRWKKLDFCPREGPLEDLLRVGHYVQSRNML